MIEPYLPEPEASPHILVTSRVDHVNFYPVPLSLLDDELSRELLLKEAGRTAEGEEEAVQAIVRKLGGLPLALELAGAYLGHRSTLSFRQYHDLLTNDLRRALPRNVSSFTEHEADLYRTLRISEDFLNDEYVLRNVLDVLTWSGSAPMGTDLISHLLSVRNDALLASALALGAELRLLQLSKDVDSYSLHRLVAHVRQGEIPLEQRLEWVERVCTRLGDWFEEKKEDFSQLSRFESEIDHLRSWQNNAVKFAPLHASKFLWLQGYPEYDRGRYAKAKSFVIDAQKILHGLGEPEPELKANLLNDLANIDLALGEHNSVRANLMDALDIRREVFGDIHRDVATSLSNIGGFL